VEISNDLGRSSDGDFILAALQEIDEVEQALLTVSRLFLFLSRSFRRCGGGLGFFERFLFLSRPFRRRVGAGVN
jgi:hypothetical protein